MNKRIKALIKQCTSIEQVRDGKTPIGPKFETFDEEKFAALIVLECIARIKLQHARDEITESWVYNNLIEDITERFRR